MIDNPDRWAPPYAEAGAYNVTFHAEATDNPVGVARDIRAAGREGRPVGQARHPAGAVPGDPARVRHAAGHVRRAGLRRPGVHPRGAAEGRHRAPARRLGRADRSSSRSTAASTPTPSRRPPRPGWTASSPDRRSTAPTDPGRRGARRCAGRPPRRRRTCGYEASRPPCGWPSSRPSGSRARPIRTRRSARSFSTATARWSVSAAPSRRAARTPRWWRCGGRGNWPQGGTAVVTLEPCNHHGRTPPCVDALLGRGRFVGGVRGRRPQPDRRRRRRAAGRRRRRRGRRRARRRRRAAARCGSGCTSSAPDLPHVTWKYATSVDGRSAAADGTSQWITSEAARADVHRRRAAADAIVVGTGTVFVDDPTLTARLPDGSLAERQPLRVVVGEREISSEANVLNDDSRTMVIRTHDPHEVIKALADRTDVLLEGGPTLAGRVPAGRCRRPDPGLRRADPAGRSGHRGRRRRGADHRPRAAMAIRRRRADRSRSAAEPGPGVTAGSQS